MHALIIVNDGMQTGGQGLFQIKTETNIAYKLLMLGAKNKGSCIETEWHRDYEGAVQVWCKKLYIIQSEIQ